MKKYISKVFGIAVLSVLFFVALPVSAHAAVSWNDNALKSLGPNVGNDCPTVAVYNTTTSQNLGVECFGSSINASAGDTVKVRVYYHNTGTSDSTDTRITVNVPTGASTNHAISGQVSGGGASAYGSANISLSSSQKLTFVSAVDYKNGSNTPISVSGNPSSGFSIGTVKGWTSCPNSNVFCHQGGLILAFRVENTTTPPPSALCSITSFSANPSSISSGNSSTLSWNTTNCSNVQISGGNLSGNQSLNGSLSTGALSGSTTYTLTASGTNTVTQQTVVSVNQVQNQCAITSFLANPTQVTSGQSSTLIWNTTNCTNVSLSGPGVNDVRLGGSTSTGPLTTGSSYVLTASNGFNSVNQTVFVSVAQSQSCAISSFYATPTQVASGGISTLYWTTTGCTTATVSGSGVNSSNLSGSVTTGAVFGTNTYTLIASGTNTVTQTVSVSATTQNQCAISTFYASPTAVSSGGISTLYWTTTGCTSATVSGNGVYSSALSGSIPTGAVYGLNSYTLTAYGTNTVTQTVAVSAAQTQQCYVNSFYATPTSVASGASSILYWSTTGGGTVTISGPGVYSNQASGSITTGAIYSTSTYTISGNCGTGGNSINQTVVVTVDTPTGVNVVTTVPTNIGSSSARLNGFVQSLGANQFTNAIAYFEYGTSSSLGLETSRRSVNSGTLTNYFDTISVSPNTTYFYRAAAVSNGITYRGSIVSFTTPGVTIVNTNTNTNTTVTTNTNTFNREVLYGTGGGSPLVMLAINEQFQNNVVVNGQVQGFGQFGQLTGQGQNVYPGDTITYYVHYKNISNVDLTNVVLNVVLPVDVAFRQTTLGVLTTNNTVAASLGTLARGQEGAITIQVTTSELAVPGTTLVATATLAFTTPSGAQDSAVAYALNTISARTSTIAGLALFGGAFFPNTLLGWILLLGLILIIILLTRHYYYRRPSTVVYNNSGPHGMGSHPDNLPH